ncbi:Uncharacterised protein [Enterobacter cloacae]|nr:Uncharacterised protein [Enterobacter cloacae]
MAQARRGIAVDLGQQRLAFALRAAQHGVEHALGPALLQLVGAADGLADRGVRRNPRVEQLVEADQQQGVDIGVGGLERLLQQARGQGLQARLPARRAEGQLLGQAAIARGDLVQLRRQRARQRGASGEHRGQCLAGGETRVHWPSTWPVANCSRRLL